MQNLCSEKLQNIAKEIKEIEMSGETSYIHGLEGLILLSCQHSPNWSIDLMRFLSESQLGLSINW